MSTAMASGDARLDSDMELPDRLFTSFREDKGAKICLRKVDGRDELEIAIESKLLDPSQDYVFAYIDPDILLFPPSKKRGKVQAIAFDSVSAEEDGIITLSVSRKKVPKELISGIKDLRESSEDIEILEHANGIVHLSLASALTASMHRWTNKMFDLSVGIAAVGFAVFMAKLFLPFSL